jgi:hypothetical protein
VPYTGDCGWTNALVEAREWIHPTVSECRIERSEDHEDIRVCRPEKYMQILVPHARESSDANRCLILESQMHICLEGSDPE